MWNKLMSNSRVKIIRIKINGRERREEGKQRNKHKGRHNIFTETYVFAETSLCLFEPDS